MGHGPWGWGGTVKEMFNTARCRAWCRSVPTIQGRRLRNGGGDLAGIRALASRNGARYRPGPGSPSRARMRVCARLSPSLCVVARPSIAVTAKALLSPGAAEGNQAERMAWHMAISPLISTPMRLRDHGSCAARPSSALPQAADADAGGLGEEGQPAEEGPILRSTCSVCMSVCTSRDGGGRENLRRGVQLGSSVSILAVPLCCCCTPTLRSIHPSIHRSNDEARKRTNGFGHSHNCVKTRQPEPDRQADDQPRSCLGLCRAGRNISKQGRSEYQCAGWMRNGPWSRTMNDEKQWVWGF